MCFLCHWRALQVFRAVQAMCLALDDSEHVKALLKECQKDKYGEVKGIQGSAEVRGRHPHHGVAP